MKQPTLADMYEAVRPFLVAFERQVNPGTFDLDNEQPIHLFVTLGECRKLKRTFYDYSDAPLPGCSERDAIEIKPRVVLSYEGGRAEVMDAGEFVQISLELLPPPPSGLRGKLRSARWSSQGPGMWQRRSDPASIGSAREILGQFFGQPEQV